MSGRRAAWVDCDVCGLSQYPADLGAETIAEARDAARQAGWRRTRNGGDVCPPCQEVATPEARDAILATEQR